MRTATPSRRDKAKSASIGRGYRRRALGSFPIDGVVVARNVDRGQTVAASLSTPELFRIANDLSRMQILAQVGESDIFQIKESQTVEFTVTALQG